jgi:hypothetical protein
MSPPGERQSAAAGGRPGLRQRNQITSGFFSYEETRITIYVDDVVIKRFKVQSEKTGKGYQTLINEALKAHVGLGEQPVTQELVRKIVREELAANR